MASEHIAPPLQSATELVQFLALLKSYNVKSYLEVGARYGGTFEAVMTRRPHGSRGVAIDFPGWDFGDDNSTSVLLNVLNRLKPKYDVTVIFGPSTAHEVVQRAQSLGPYDCVFIDADHSYKAVKRDFELYAPMGKLIVLHDIAAEDGFANRLGIPVEVGKFWREIKAKHKHAEIVTPGSQMGIGVIFR